MMKMFEDKLNYLVYIKLECIISDSPSRLHNSFQGKVDVGTDTSELDKVRKTREESVRKQLLLMEHQIQVSSK